MLALFNPIPKPGWMAIELTPDAVRVAHVARAAGARPKLMTKRHFARVGSDVEDLGRLRRLLGLQRFRCTTSMDPGTYQIVQLTAPAVPPAEMNAALRWSVKDSLDFAVEDAVIDSLSVPRDGAPMGRPGLMLAVAARRGRVAVRVQAFQRSGVRLTTIDVAETAQRNLAGLFEEEGRALAFLSFDAHGGLLTFTCNGELYSFRHIDVHAAALAEAGNSAAGLALHERIALELQRSLDSFDRVFSQIALQRLMVAPLAGAEALVAHLRENLAVPVETARLAEVLDCGDEAFTGEADEADWLHAVGLALRPEGQA